MFRESVANEKILATEGDLYQAQKKMRKQKNMIRIVKVTRIVMRSLSIVMGILVLQFSGIGFAHDYTDCFAAIGDFVPLYRVFNETSGL